MAVAGEDLCNAKVLHHDHRREINEGEFGFMVVPGPEWVGAVELVRRDEDELMPVELDRTKQVVRKMPRGAECNHAEEGRYKLREDEIRCDVAPLLPSQFPVLLCGDGVVRIFGIGDGQPGPGVNKDHGDGGD